jgi:alkylation response protein AidB-like acyl-CoA dehydrogenase
MSSSSRDERWRRLRSDAAALAEVFEKRSLDRFDSGEFVAENIEDLRAAGILALNVPAELGGVEASLGENAEILQILAGGCGSTGFTFGIHAILTGSLRGVVEGDLRKKFFGEVAGGAFVAGPFTDGNSGSNWTRPSTVARRVDDGDGFVLDGVKHFFTGLEACTHMVVTAGLTDEHLEPPFNLAAFFIPRPPNFADCIVSRWTGFAMPMSGSHSVALRSLPVSADDMLVPEGLAPLMVMSRQQWGHYCFAAVFLGLAKRAYTLAVENVRGRSNTAVADLSLLPGVQFAVARMRASVSCMDALLQEYCASHAEPGDDLLGFVADTCVPKYFICNEAQQVVQTAFDVIGGSGIRERSRIGQIYRDVRAGPLLPFTNDVAREFIGKSALGVDPVATPRWP